MRNEAMRAERRAAFEGIGSGRVVVPIDRWRRHDREVEAVASLVARRRNIPIDQLLHRSRRKPEIAEARQLAMYLAHVVLGRTYSDVGQFFGRDRTTVAHACACIEDMRDGRRFDEEVSEIEAAIEGGQPAETRHAAR